MNLDSKKQPFEIYRNGEWVGTSFAYTSEEALDIFCATADERDERKPLPGRYEAKVLE